MRIGAVVGGHVAFSLGGIVALQGEVLYTQKGLKAKAPSGIDEDVEFKFDYINVPVLLRLGLTGGTGLQFLVGPSFNFNTSAKVAFEGLFDDEEDIKDEVEDIEIGLVLGAGYYRLAADYRRALRGRPHRHHRLPGLRRRGELQESDVHGAGGHPVRRVSRRRPHGASTLSLRKQVCLRHQTGCSRTRAILCSE